jgi:hypothetical protein
MGSKLAERELRVDKGGLGAAVRHTKEASTRRREEG